ncbi:MAG: hypothetical protein A2Y33_07130 [Spirochaetes bacterium GWF1_51_8]|nr:MAG: hypothetical protein A2Y33_07130 [Spirochaetes bacterium GWF1_51_8]
MILYSILPLYKNMKVKCIDACCFKFSMRKIEVGILFIIKKLPYRLAISFLRKNLTIIYELSEDLSFNEKIEMDKYYALCNILGLKPDPENRFSPFKFILELGKHFPRKVEDTIRVDSNESIKLFLISLSEDKNYHFGWYNNNKTGKHVSKENLQKTMTLLGEDVYELSKETNFSTCWTAKRNQTKNKTVRKN